MISIIKKEIEQLRTEMIAIDITSKNNDLDKTELDDNQTLILKSKIQVLNKILISYNDSVIKTTSNPTQHKWDDGLEFYDK